MLFQVFHYVVVSNSILFFLADIIFKVVDKDHPNFRREDLNLVHPVEIPLMTVRECNSEL